MKQFLLIITVGTLAILSGCSWPNADNSLKESKATAFSNSLYTAEFEGIEEDSLDGREGFYLYFSITALDDTRTLDVSKIQMTLPDEISDEKGNMFNQSGPTSIRQTDEQPHIIEVDQFFAGELEENSSHLTVPARLVLSDLEKMVRFENITDEMAPITRQELTITQLDWNEKKLTLEAKDLFSMNTTEWSLINNDEKIYPVFSNTESNEDGEFRGTLEFAFQPDDTFTLVAERNRTTDKEWELPYVIPIN
ncbi:hypothetical protein J2S78_001192 [Salibacterium salarium]|uniref:hypothetical protein n=1 Tax=Salibacterium salarium TaxID=284579 RepID=UPI00278A87EE|nr:hypothetical protein [Salibacterium salarium]MDQ0298772.1 hypothetical protein [Salibacterium salarium]